MAITWEQNFVFIVNKILGNSFFNNPVQLIGLIMMVVAAIMGVFVLKTIYEKYKSTKDIGFVIYLIAGIALFAAVISNIIMEIINSSLGLFDFTRYLAIFSQIFITIAAVCACIFAFRNTYPDRVKILTIIVIMLAVIANVALAWAIIANVVTGKIAQTSSSFVIITIFPLEMLILIYCGAIPLAFWPAVVFFYFAAKVRKENKAKSSHSILFGISHSCIGFGYIFTIFQILPPQISPIIVRSFYLAFIITITLCFTTPEWYKRRIGWVDEISD
jgi:hypothetical protein